MDVKLFTDIAANPNSEAAWTAYAAFLADNGRDDEAAAVRGYWPTLAENIAFGVSVPATHDQLRKYAKLLALRARMDKQRRYEP